MSPEFELEKEPSSVVDEVRAIRRNILAQNGNDLSRLFAELKATEAEFKSRSGRFAAMQHGPTADDVMKRWKMPRPNAA
jgi:hypothetical protein